MPQQTFVAACAGMRSGRDPIANRDAAVALVREAASRGAGFVQTPEMTSLVERSRASLFEKVRPEESDPTLAGLREAARTHRIVVQVGSLAVKQGDKIANRAFVIDAQGEIAARYDKIHLFDVDLPNGESWRESATYTGGDRAVLAELPWGLLGVTICYDVRFPALYQGARGRRCDGPVGARLLHPPDRRGALDRAASRPRHRDGIVHDLGRAGGTHEDGRETFGHSIIVDPWGRVLAEGGAEPGLVMAEIDLSLVADARGRIPALKHGRPFEVELQGGALEAASLAAAE